MSGRSSLPAPRLRCDRRAHHHAHRCGAGRRSAQAADLAWRPGAQDHHRPLLRQPRSRPPPGNIRPYPTIARPTPCQSSAVHTRQVSVGLLAPPSSVQRLRCVGTSTPRQGQSHPKQCRPRRLSDIYEANAQAPRQTYHPLVGCSTPRSGSNSFRDDEGRWKPAPASWSQ